MTPAHFFDDVVPALARERGKQFPQLAMPITVAVDTDAWTLTLHDDAHPTRHGGDPNAGFALWLSADAFLALLDGTLDEERAIASKSVGVRGDVRVLEQLGRFLQGAGHAARTRSMTGGGRG